MSKFKEKSGDFKGVGDHLGMGGKGSADAKAQPGIDCARDREGTGDRFIL